AIGRRDAVDGVAELVYGGGFTDHLGAGARALAQLLDLTLKLECLQRAQSDEDQPVGLERLLDVVVGAALDGGDGRLDVAMAGNDDDREIRVAALHVGDHLETIEAASLQTDFEND